MLIDKLGGIVDLIVDHEEAVLLGVVLSNILVGVLLRHFGGCNVSFNGCPKREFEDGTFYARRCAVTMGAERGEGASDVR